MDWFAVSAPGFEPLVALELQRLGIHPHPEVGGVSWQGDLASGMRANLHLRSASRILARVAEFQARSFIELERHLRRLDWPELLGSRSPLKLRVTSRKSRLYHQGAIEERFARELSAALGVPASRASGAPEEEGDAVENGGTEAEGQLLIVRFLRDRCLVSVDSSGELLHRRGYRQQVAKAPLRETLAAALLIALDWAGDRALVDPLCGSGTIPIEGALLARKIPPGLANSERQPRRFAFEEWPAFDADLWGEIVDRARAEIRPQAGIPILGSDRDAGAIEASIANAERAGVEADIRFTVRPLSQVEPPAPEGLLIMNPPYGVRVGQTKALRDLYASIGALARGPFAAWTTALLGADRVLEGQTKLPFREVLRTRNGGIPVRLQSWEAAEEQIGESTPAALRESGRGS